MGIKFNDVFRSESVNHVMDSILQEKYVGVSDVESRQVDYEYTNDLSIIKREFIVEFDYKKCRYSMGYRAVTKNTDDLRKTTELMFLEDTFKRIF